ncbi:saccharolysin [Trichoderma asperellum]|uniref:Saccharolysin n=1 Tax=Trichoderma asperellum TaxID=101201 RepID=A0A6V8QW87_TRIAP|nr:saccharolysin [Trichoderma asperellum]
MSSPQAHELPASQCTASSLVQGAELVLDNSAKLIDRLVASSTLENVSFANFILPIAWDENVRISHRNSSVIHEFTSSDPVLREAAAKVRRLFHDFETTLFMREDVSRRCEAVRQKKEDISVESKHLLEVFYQTFLRNGALSRSAEDKSKVQEINQSLEKLEFAFRENIRTADASLSLDPDELQGVPQRLLDGLPREADSGKVLLSASDLQNGLYRTAPESSEARRAILYAYETLHQANRPIFDEIIEQRALRARLLGYRSHAALRISERLAETPETVSNFLSEIAIGLREAGEGEVSRLRDRKQADVESRGKPFDGKLWLWDVSHYHQKVVAENFSLDGMTISDYFPLASVLNNGTELLGHLFGLRFERVSKEQNWDARDIDVAPQIHIWHEDVQHFVVWDNGEQGKFLGHLYLDLFSRPGKSGGPSFHNIVPGFTNEAGHRQHPHSAILSDYSRPADGSPCTLRYFQVVLLFHELGHAIHDLVSVTKFAQFHGPDGTPVDFGEFPSQLLENLCHVPLVIHEISHHVSTLRNGHSSHPNQEPAAANPPKKIPEASIRVLLQRSKALEALHHLDQIFLARFDLEVNQADSHQVAEATDIPALFNSLRAEICSAEIPQPNQDEPGWGCYYTSFKHFINEYDAGYYGYLYAKSIADDVFDTLGGDAMNAEAFKRYRRMVLEKGGSVPGRDALKEFLGREPSTEDFCKHLGMV